MGYGLGTTPSTWDLKLRLQFCRAHRISGSVIIFSSYVLTPMTLLRLLHKGVFFLNEFFNAIFHWNATLPYDISTPIFEALFRDFKIGGQTQIGKIVLLRNEYRWVPSILTHYTLLYYRTVKKRLVPPMLGGAWERIISPCMYLTSKTPFGRWMSGSEWMCLNVLQLPVCSCRYPL